MIYGHGDDSYRYGDKIKIDFSSNVYQQADLSGLKDFLKERLDVIGHYPEPEPRELEVLIARKLGINDRAVMVTSGAQEAITLIAQHYSGWASIIPQPTYNEYADVCRAYGHLISYDSADDLELLPDERLYWLCNPNSPTGNVLLKSLILHIARQHPKHIYIIDQSYESYTLKGMPQPIDIVDSYNILLIHSMSKKYCIPGLRLGYITASPILLDRLREHRQPWTVNALAIEAGKYLVEHEPQMIPDLQALLDETQRLATELSDIDGVMVMHTDTNFMLVNIDWANVTKMKNWLIEKYGILIRDASNYHGLDDHCFRIAAQTPEENDLLVKAIRDYRIEK